MKLQRHAAILRIVRERRIESQDGLRAGLAAENISVTQATLSRDIRELGLAKLVDPQGGAYYANPHEGSLRPDLGQVLPDAAGERGGDRAAAGDQDRDRAARRPWPRRWIRRGGRRSSGPWPATTPC